MATPDIEASLDTAQHFLQGSFNGTSFFKLESCFAGEVDIVSELAGGALDSTIETTQTAPWQAFSGATLVFSFLLLFLGFYLVRAVNFIGGLYLGSSLSLFLLSVFAVGTPLVRALRTATPNVGPCCATIPAPELRPSRRACRRWRTAT